MEYYSELLFGSEEGHPIDQQEIIGLLGTAKRVNTLGNILNSMKYIEKGKVEEEQIQEEPEQKEPRRVPPAKCQQRKQKKRS